MNKSQMQGGKWARGLALGLMLYGMSSAAGMSAAASLPEASGDPSGKLALVENGESRAPIVVFKDAPPKTRQAAEELAEYIAKTSGAKPEVLEGCPDPVPEHAIWVGYQPKLNELFPEIDFNFQHPEEILIAANANHLVIAGRDVWDPERPDGLDRGGRRVPGVQSEYGTINAVYTFLQDQLGVRWLWPGELGEDILEQRTIAFAPFKYRYHPTMRMRDGMLARSALATNRKRSSDWVRFQRLQLDSLEGLVGGHGYNDWWDKYHQDHPEYFALQLDGTRSLVTDPSSAKICHSNPDVWRQWVDNVVGQIAEYPERTLFNASPGDGGFSGHCVCESCKAWDHLDGVEVHLRSGGTGQAYVSLTDRHITYANKVARLLKERFPERNDAVAMLAYGAWRAPPVAAKPDDNVVIINVANFFWNVNSEATEADGSSRTDWFVKWGDTGARQIWRPNTGSPAGWQAGLPDIPIERVVEAMQFAAQQGAVGIYIDSVWEMWGTQGPLYYAMAHVLWNHKVDWRAVMDDYYRRGFGPAAAELKTYWTMLEDARNRKVDEYPGELNGYEEVYDEAFFTKAYGLLDRAAEKVADAPEKYAQRIAFVRVGLDHTRFCTKLRQAVVRYFASNEQDQAAVEQARGLWDQIKRNCDENPIALDWFVVQGGRRMHRVGLFNLDNLKGARSHHLSAWKRKAREQAGNHNAQPRDQAELQSAREAGWELVFHDSFERDTLGEDWLAIAGDWRIEDGALQGMGTLMSAKGFPGDAAAGFQRMEFRATSAADQPRVSDLSCLLHTRPDPDNTVADPINHGYFFQFGGRWNKVNRIRRNGQDQISDETRPSATIVPGKTHEVVVENDKGQVNLFVDGVSILTTSDARPFVGEGLDRVGFFFYTPFRVEDVKVYVKRLAGGLDEDEDEVQ